MLIEALTWWADRMAEVLRFGAGRGGGRRGHAVIITIGEAGEPAIMTFVRRNGRRTVLGQFDDDAAVRAARQSGAPVVLQPPRGMLLEKQLTLPMAAERALDRVIGYEMNRITPFEPDEVFWSHVVTRHERSRGRLHVRLSLIPRAGLGALVGELGRAGLMPSALEVAVADGAPRFIPLQHDLERQAWRRRTTVWLGAACGALTVVAVGLPFLLQSLALAEATARITALQPQVSEAQALRQRLEAASAGQDTIAGERRHTGDAMEVLSALTALLPDDTYLDDLTLRQRRLTITGQSAAAPKLIALLAADPSFSNPGFSAPVTRNNAAGRDAFSIGAEVRP